MTPITFWFDPVSPYAYLAFERLPHALEGCSYVVRYRPVMLAGLLRHWGQLGPAEVVPKRDWTYRQVAWLARQAGTPLQMPAAHPFNPLALLRLLVACGPDGTANRYQCETVLRQVWRTGTAGDDAAVLASLTAQLAPVRDPRSDVVKQALRANTEMALAQGVFGVPTLELPHRDPDRQGPLLFWGLDALDMAAARLRGDPWFDTAWERAAEVPWGVRRSG